MCATFGDEELANFGDREMIDAHASISRRLRRHHGGRVFRSLFNFRPALCDNQFLNLEFLRFMAQHQAKAVGKEVLPHDADLLFRSAGRNFAL